MEKTIYYSDKETPIRLGDIVSVRLGFRRHEGRIVYLPFVSPPNPEMQIEGLVFVGIRVPDKAMVGITVLPESSSIKKSIKFLKRDPDSNFEEVKSDEELFEDSEGNPL